MVTGKRSVQLAAVSRAVKWRTYFENEMAKLDAAGLVFVDSKLESCMDDCYPGKTGLTLAEAKELLAKIERGEFSPGGKRRTKGNGEHP